MNFAQAHNDYLDPDRHDNKADEDKWVTFTRRTNDPKLKYLEQRLAANGIESRRKGESWHAPILQIKQKDLDAAWEILTPIDNVPDDDKGFK